MKLDVVVPTFNRANGLKQTLDSLLRAGIPDGMQVLITVVDNNSGDDTRAVVEDYARRFPGRVSYVFEKNQGRSFALNAGIAATSNDLVGMIDDDEEIDEHWYETVYAAFESGEIDFVGGPYHPSWPGECPQWIPSSYGSVVGWVDGGETKVPFDQNYPGILMGGNAVIRRSMLDKVGPYKTWLGRTDKGLLSGEDEDMYHRLLAAGAKGFYLPDLIIHHKILPARLTKKYFRSWCFWRGVSLGLLERTRKQACPYLFGVPRWQYRTAARGLLIGIRSLVVKPKQEPEAFASELALWDFLGLFYGKHFHRADGRG